MYRRFTTEDLAVIGTRFTEKRWKGARICREFPGKIGTSKSEQGHKQLGKDWPYLNSENTWSAKNSNIRRYS